MSAAADGARRPGADPAEVPREERADHLMRAAAQAAPPSLRGVQPWLLRAGAGVAVTELWASPDRDLRARDPTGRVVQIACGAALLRLRLAASVAGREPVDRLLPRAEEPLLLATIRLAGRRRPADAERALYAAIGREARAEPRSADPVTAGALGDLAQAAAVEGAMLDILDGPAGRRIAALAAGATRPRGAASSLPRAVRGPAPSRRGAGPGPAPRLAVISAPSGRRAGWLRTGQALQRVLLLAVTLGISATPLQPVLEVPGLGLDGALRSLGIEGPQLVLRLSRAGPDDG